MRLTVSAMAGRDLKSIYDFTVERWGVDQADDYAASFVAAFDQLLEYATPGVVSSTRQGEYRRFRCGHHFVFYRFVKDLVRIERVLHERMDAPRHLS